MTNRILPATDNRRDLLRAIERAIRDAVAEAVAGLQPSDATLTALAGLNSTPGLLAQTAEDAFTKRSLAAPAAGLSITNPAGTAGNPTFALANDLEALEGLAGTGLAKRTGTDAWAIVNHDEGTFTPTLTFGGGSTGMAYTDQFGRYARIGNRAFFEIRIGLSAKGSSTGTALISNLPFSAAATASTAGGFRASSMAAGVNSTYWRVTAGASTIALDNFAAGAAANLTDASFTNSSLIILEGFYSIA